MAKTHKKETAMRSGQALVLSLAIAAAAGCRENPLVPEGNIIPVANAGLDQMIEYAGAPVTVTLDGSMSRDEDGAITVYRWFGGNEAPDGGLGRGRPADVPANWPDDVLNPTVVLDRGSYVFTLWVIDDKGAVSEPDTVTISIGSDPIAECMAGVIPALAAPCATCLCGIEMPDCRARVVETACDASCWALIQCIGANCPDFATMAMAGDFSCLTTNCLMQYQASQAGATPMGATPAGECARMCPTECASGAM
jgi:hypothetical protein